MECSYGGHLTGCLTDLASLHFPIVGAENSNSTFNNLAKDFTELADPDAAGAVVTGESAQRAESLGLHVADYLSQNDAYSFFEKVGDLLKTGPTGTNVNDLALLFSL